MRVFISLVLLFLAGCQSGGGGAVQGAALAANIGAAAAINRATGNCYTQCAPGTSCNHQTGLCETLPCHGQCKDGQVCDESGFVPRCIAVGQGLVIVPNRPDGGTVAAPTPP